MSKANPNDILIGDNSWIPFADIAGRQSAAVDIDNLLGPTADFWTAMEMICIAGCCGLAAFDFTPNGVSKAAESEERGRLLSRLNDLRAAVLSLPSDIVVSSRLNNYCDKGTFLQLLDHIIGCVRGQGGGA